MKMLLQSKLIKSTLLRRTLTALIFTSALSTISACATVEGAGKDIQSAGEAIEEGAENASN